MPRFATVATALASILVIACYAGALTGAYEAAQGELVPGEPVTQAEGAATHGELLSMDPRARPGNVPEFAAAIAPEIAPAPGFTRPPASKHVVGQRRSKLAHAGERPIRLAVAPGMASIVRTELRREGVRMLGVSSRALVQQLEAGHVDAILLGVRSAEIRKPGELARRFEMRCVGDFVIACVVHRSNALSDLRSADVEHALAQGRWRALTTLLPRERRMRESVLSVACAARASGRFELVQDVVASVRHRPETLGLTWLEDVDDRVRTLRVDGVAPGDAAYPLRDRLYILARRDRPGALRFLRDFRAPVSLSNADA